MPILIIDTAEGIRIRTEIAGVGSRLAAGLLDMIVLVSLYLTVLLLGLGIGILAEGTGIDGLGQLSEFVYLSMAAGFLLSFPTYFAFFHVIWNGQTPGKRALGLRAVSADGAPASTMQHLLRSFFWPVDAFLPVPIPLGCLLIGVTPRCLRLGDMAAGTIVLHEAKHGQYTEPWPDESWSGREKQKLSLSVGMARLFQDEDVVFLRDAIGRQDLSLDQRKKIYRDIVVYYGEKLGFSPSGSEAAALKELYLFARESRRG